VSKLVERPDAFNELAGKRLRALYNHTNFQADLHVQMLRSELFERPYEPSQELAFNDYERIFLSPRDRWHRHFHGFESWSVPGKAISSDQAGSSAAIEINKRRSRALIWISGNTGRQNVSWVSSLSVDLLAHLREFSNIDTAYVFCKRGHGVRYTPAMIIKGLAAQLLEQYPEVAIQNVRILSKKRFQEVGDYQKPGAARLAWRLLQDVVRLMEDAARTRNCKVLILIDRLDLCVSNEDFSVLKDLIPRLQQLSHQSSLVRVMITAAKVPALKVPTLRTAPEWLLSYGKCFHTPDRKGESDEQG
jgi:hypothetical protein